ncbi:hypothetical protein BH09ACT1_BH09ACT1_06510 [soil metagenome]
MFAFLNRALIRIHARFVQSARSDGDRGDVPGWVLITIMTAGLVVGIWAIAGPALNTLFTTAVNGVTAPGKLAP